MEPSIWGGCLFWFGLASVFAFVLFPIVSFHFCCFYSSESPQMTILLPQLSSCWDFRCESPWLFITWVLAPLIFQQVFLVVFYFFRSYLFKAKLQTSTHPWKPSQGQNNQYHCPHLVPLEGPKGRNTLGVVILIITMISGIPPKRPAWGWLVVNWRFL